MTIRNYAIMVEENSHYLVTRLSKMEQKLLKTQC